MEYTIWCDESVDKGKYYSDFYGGVLAFSTDIDAIVNSISQKKLELNLHGEVKWVKVTENYLEKYMELISHFFEFVREGKLKVRIMFRQNCHVATNLSKRQYDEKFFLLYYQFIKHAFGLSAVKHAVGTTLRIYFDKLPDKNSKNEKFIKYVYDLNKIFLPNNISINQGGIAQIDSKRHDILQCLDIVLGSMAFTLNDMNKLIQPNAKHRGKKQ